MLRFEVTQVTYFLISLRDILGDMGIDVNNLNTEIGRLPANPELWKGKSWETVNSSIPEVIDGVVAELKRISKITDLPILDESVKYLSKFIN